MSVVFAAGGKSLNLLFFGEMCVDVHIDSGISVLGAFCQARGYEVPAGATNPFFLGIWEDVSTSQ